MKHSDCKNFTPFDAFKGFCRRSGYNDSLENARTTVDFMKENGYFEINLLPFHRLGTSKWEQLGRRYPYREQPNLPKEQLGPLQNFYKKPVENGIFPMYRQNLTRF